MTLFKASLKSHWKFVLGVTLFILMFVVIAISMYDPESAERMKQMFEMMPDGFMKAFGFDELGSELTSYLSNYLHGYIMLISPLIGSIVLANSLIAKHVDTGNMAYLLSTPNSRIKIVVTQMMFLLTSMTFMFAINIGVALIMSEASYTGLLDISAFLQLNLVAFLVAIVVSGISFLASCIFNDTKRSLTVGVGIPVLLFVAKMISEISDKLENLKYASIYTVIDIQKILEGDPTYVVVSSIILVGVSVLLFAASIIIFNRKNLVI
ncbi:MAG: ABC transporter permease subunit [Clostridiales bacterium]|nr:ABC transporter permease subunit [Clostridiales bacterium]